VISALYLSAPALSILFRDVLLLNLKVDGIDIVFEPVLVSLLGTGLTKLEFKVDILKENAKYTEKIWPEVCTSGFLML